MLDLVTVSEGDNSAQIQVHYTYTASPSQISLELSIKLNVGGSSLESSKVAVPFGEWLIVQLEADQTLQEYNLRVEKYGGVSIQGESHILPQLTTLDMSTEGPTRYLKELMVWDSRQEDNANIGDHKCK